MRYYKDLAPKLIAREIEIPYGTVKSRLKTALTMLRNRTDELNQGKRGKWLLSFSFITVKGKKGIIAGSVLTKEAFVAAGLLLFAIA